MPRRSNRLAAKPKKDYRAMAGLKSRRAPVRKAPLVRLINKTISGRAETKTAIFYQSYNPGTSPARAVGNYASRGYALQNNGLIANNTDILQLIPYVFEGTADNQRIGDRISPSSLIVNGSIRVSLPSLAAYRPVDIKVVIFVLQHVQLKDYGNLYANNIFTQMLETGENTTTNFSGQVWDSNLPIAKQYYRVLKRKTVTLRYAGSPALPPNSSIANAHTYYSTYSFGLGKKLPKHLKYPENNAPVAVVNQPTNSSIFMCMGYVDFVEPSNGSTPSPSALLEQTYVAKLNFKDL